MGVRSAYQQPPTHPKLEHPTWVIKFGFHVLDLGFEILGLGFVILRLGFVILRLGFVILGLPNVATTLTAICKFWSLPVLRFAILGLGFGVLGLGFLILELVSVVLRRCGLGLQWLLDARTSCEVIAAWNNAPLLWLEV